MDNDDYDLLPHSELKKIEHEIDSLKASPDGPPASMRSSMDELSNSLKSMIAIFSEAKNELKIEDEEKELLSKKIGPMTEKLDKLLDQNEKIAEAILSVADMIKKLDSRVERVGQDCQEIMSSQAKPSPYMSASFVPPPPPRPAFPAQQAVRQMQPAMPGMQQMPQLMPRPVQPMQQPQPQMQPAFQGSQGSFNPLLQNPQGMQQGYGQRSLDQELVSEPQQGVQQAPDLFSQGSQQQQEDIFKPESISMPPPPPAPKKGFFGK